MPRILISGASGLIGRALARSFESHGHEVTRLVRLPTHDPQEIQWNPMFAVRPDLVSNFDAVVHLSGENVAARWSAEKKRRVRESRVLSTQNLSRALALATQPPQTFLCASAIGYYGDRGDEMLTEESTAGKGFLAEVCREWEAAAEPAARAGIRAINLRFGIVLSKDGGALKPMLLPFRLGLGGRIGTGRQWWSWIHIDDVVAAVNHIVKTPAISGPVNMTAPNPVTNAEFTRRLGAALKRPAVLPVPAFAVRLLFREFADEGVLASARVLPSTLMESEFKFQHTELGSALIDLLSEACG